MPTGNSSLGLSSAISKGPFKDPFEAEPALEAIMNRVKSQEVNKLLSSFDILQESVGRFWDVSKENQLSVKARGNSVFLDAHIKVIIHFKHKKPPTR